MSEWKPFYILFRHKPSWNERGKGVRYSIWKEWDDGKIWDSPTNEVVDYYDTRTEAQNALNKIRLP